MFMESYIKGNYRRSIFQSDKGFCLAEITVADKFADGFVLDCGVF